MSMNLPTPPRTTHKDKENLPPTPLTPSKTNSRTPRIVWSQENLHHAYTTQIRQLPASSRTKEPAKSILKRSSLPLMPLPPSEQPARGVTPEPVDPLQHPLYLNSPVSTLIASLQSGGDAKITLTDLIEAYSVLSARLKTKTLAMLDMYGPIPALEPLRDHRDKLVETFHRDIGRAFVNPQSSPPPLQDSPWSSPSSVGSIKKRGYTEQEVKHARDLCNLSHAAMRCFSNIAVVPVLLSIFSDTQLGEILTDILAIPLAPSLPTPNARKTYQIAVWTLQIQRLPISVLTPAADRITYALRRGIDGELGREGKKGAASDGLRAVATLVAFQPSVFLPPFAEILSSILTNLTSQNLTLRAQAAHALLAIAHAYARFRAPPNALATSLSQAITTFLVEQHQTRKIAQDVSPLGQAFRTCLQTETPVHLAQSPIWTLSVTAAFVVLSGGDALTHPRAVKFVLGHLHAAMAVKRTTVRATAGLVWRALVWACMQLDNGEQDKEHKDAGWKVVCQIVDGAIGISVVATLVGQKERREERVTRGLEVVRAMIRKGGRTCEEAVDVLERLLSGVGSDIEKRQEENWMDGRLLVESLFDGTLLHAEWKGLVGHVKEALASCVAVKDVKPLHEDEVTQHWDLLFAIWKEAVERAPLGEDGDVPSALLNTWQALLLTQAQLSQGCEHLTSAPTFISHLTELLKSFLTDPSLEWSLDAGTPSWSSQPLKLGFVRNLWSVARNVFSAPTLAGAAQVLLCEVLRHEYLLSQIQVRDAWAALCAELVLAGMPELVRSLWEGQEHGLDEVKRGLWRVISQRWVEHAGSWNGAIELLRVPFAFPIVWEFDRDDLELWVRLVDCALLAAAARKISPVIVLDTIAREIGEGHNHTSLYAALPYLLSGVDASATEHPPAPQHPSVLLTLTNDILVASYPPPDAGGKPMLLAVVESLTEIVKIACKEVLVEFLMRVQDGVTIWIQDEKEVFTSHEYNQQIVPFYVASLEALKAIPPSSDTLYKLTPLFASAFNHIPAPALGPSTFKSFWVETYQHFGKLESDYPEELKPILRNIQEAMCASDEVFAPGLSPENQTQDPDIVDLPLSIVPDSLEEPPFISGNYIDGSCVPDKPSKKYEGYVCHNIDHKVSDQGFGADQHALSSQNVTELRIISMQPEDPIASHDASASQEAPGPRTEDSQSLSDHIEGALSFQHSHVSDSSPIQTVSPYPDPQPSSPSLTKLPASPVLSSAVQEASLASSVPPHKSPLVSSAPSIPQSVKKEDPDINPDTAMILGMSQSSNSSQQSRSSGSSLGKRRRSRIFRQSSKKRKTAPSAGVEIINISDDEDSERVALDVSIIVAPIKRRKSLDTRSLDTCSATVPFRPPLTPKSTSQPSAMSSSSRKRSFFEAVELPKLQALERRKYVSFGSSPEASPCRRKESGRARSASQAWVPKHEPDEAAELPSSTKRRRTSDPFGKGKGKGRARHDWSDESPRHPTLFGPSGSLDIGSDDTDVHETPLQASDASLPSSRPGKISASHIISPLLCRSRSEAYDPPSDDASMSSSPLKGVTARRLQRARTVPALPADALGEAATIPTRPVSTRRSSEEFLALEHAHVVVASGVSRMNVHELLEASKMVNQINGVLGDEMTRKLGTG